MGHQMVDMEQNPIGFVPPLGTLWLGFISAWFLSVREVWRGLEMAALPDSVLLLKRHSRLSGLGPVQIGT
jgi:hypothetical protein